MNRQAVALFRTSCEVLDVSAFLSHPTAAHLAPFILPSPGWRLAPRRSRAVLRQIAI